MRIMLLLLLPLQLLGSIELSHEEPDQTVQLYFLSMAGAYEHVSGSPHRAKHTYEQVTQLAPASIALQHAALRLAFEREDYPGVIALAAHVDATESAHQEAALYLAQAYLFTDKVKPALTLLAQLRKEYPNHERIDYFIALCHLKHGDAPRAHRVIDSVLAQSARENKHFLFHFLKAKLLCTEGVLEKAIYHIVRALSQVPRFSKGILLYGALLERTGKITDALEQYQRYIDLTKDTATTKKVIALHFDAGNFTQARTLLLSMPQDSADYFHDLALVSHQLNELDAALSFLDKAFAKNPRHSKSQSLKTQILLAQKNYTALSNLYTMWLNDQPRNEHLLSDWYRLASQGVGMNNVLTVLERLTRSHPTYQACFALADLLQSQAEYEAARKWYNRALDDSMLTRHHLLESKLHFQIACSYYQEQNFTLAYDEVQKALACTPPYPSAHNLAALIIIEAGGSLNRAQDHISHALFAAPKYPPYLDTRRQLSAIMLPE